MNPEREVEIAGKLAALEMMVIEALSFGLAPIRARADLVEELKQQIHARIQQRLPDNVRPCAIACADHVLYASLSTAEQLAARGVERVG